MLSRPLILLFIFMSVCVFSQTKKIDSLLQASISHIKEDTQKVNIYIKLSRAYAGLNTKDTVLRDKSMLYAQNAVELGKKISYKKGIAKGSIALGDYYFKINNIVKAFDNFQSSLKLAEQIKDSAMVATAANKIGYIHHFITKNHARAKYYFEKALVIVRIRSDKRDIAKQLTNLGSTNSSLGDHSTCFNNYEEAFNLFSEIHDTSSMTIVAGNIGEEFMKVNKPEKAYKYFVMARNFALKLNSPRKIAYNEDQLGSLHLRLNELEKAEKLLISAYDFAIKENFTELKKNTSENLWHLYEKKNDSTKALFFQNKYLIAKEDFVTSEKLSMISDMENSREIEKIELQNETELKIRELEHNNVTQRQNLIIISVAVILIIIGFALYITLKRHKVTIQQKKIIEEQKVEVERKNEVIEEKQKEILDSINYAKRIQVALLANKGLLNEKLGSDNYFVFFKPKDIVSGDFYWATTVHDNNTELFYLAVCDSTGHGVPGAFMSLLNIGFLSEAIKEKNIYEPNKVLNYVRARLIENISQEGQKDGMDAALICIDRKNKKITYAAANNEPVMINNGRLILLEKDKMPVGKGEKLDDFKLFTIPYEPGSILYMYTDGYADQFGGPKGKKFKYKSLEQLLLTHHQLALSEQGSLLDKNFTAWKGGLEQVDDVCVIGVKV